MHCCLLVSQLEVRESPVCNQRVTTFVYVSESLAADSHTKESILSSVPLSHDVNLNLRFDATSPLHQYQQSNRKLTVKIVITSLDLFKHRAVQLVN
jgi:hypothetical protein